MTNAKRRDRTDTVLGRENATVTKRMCELTFLRSKASLIDSEDLDRTTTRMERGGREMNGRGKHMNSMTSTTTRGISRKIEHTPMNMGGRKDRATSTTPR